MTNRRLLAVFAHPDDESFRPGGTLAMLDRWGVRVWVLCATRGEAGVHGLAPEQAGQVRQAELQCACHALGIEPPRLLDYRDGTLPQVDEEQAIEQVVRAVRELRPQVLLTWPPDGVSGHPDHVAVSRWTGEAFQRAADPAAYPEHEAEGLSPHTAAGLYHIVVPRSLAEALKMNHLHTVPDEAVTLAVDVSAVWEAKMTAIRCHRTQMGRSPILDAPEEKRRLFLGTEYFRLATARPDLPAGSEENFFERLEGDNL
jgi:LmbE family N-acetylglucosaminyl deacetylase